MVANPKPVPDNDAVARGLPYHSPAEESHIDTTAPREQVTSTVPQAQLLAIRLSGKQWKIETFRRKLWTSSVSPGETQKLLDMKGYPGSGKTMAAKGVLNPLLRM